MKISGGTFLAGFLGLLEAVFLILESYGFHGFLVFEVFLVFWFSWWVGEIFSSVGAGIRMDFLG